jgi:peptidoglycan/xylan/chitin deacetylase (PgdA/CDA1 family)
MDDVLVHSEPMKDLEFQKFRKHHQWCLEAPKLFYPIAAVLCKEIQDFPDAIAYIRSQLDEHKLFVDLHGWEHIDYTKLTQEQVEEHLEKSFDFMLNTFNCLPIRWAPPWGGISEAMQQACRKYSLTLEGVTNPVIDQGDAVAMVKKHGTIECLQGKIIMVHWFERGLKLYRIIKTGVHGTWEEAAKAEPEYFKDE